MRFILFVSFFLVSLSSYETFAQTISGTVIEEKSTAPVAFAFVYARKMRDSTVFFNATTDSNGKFSLKVEMGMYRLVVHKPGYTANIQSVRAFGEGVNLGTITITDSAESVAEAIIRAKAPAVKQVGDTLEINASKYKTHPDATAEDLLRKMPGITIEKGQIKANGETVKKVTVDGRDFYGEDAGAALQNLPAEIVDKIQIFDRASDQAQFTGFDDGNVSRSLNIITKKGMSNGTFGKVYAGYGTDDKYQSGLVFNRFKGNQRFSVLGMSNNINLQNFSSQDLLSMNGAGSGPRRGPRGRDGNESENFLVSQSNGISQTHGAGLNYSNQWGTKTKLAASYFFNNTDNKQQTNLVRNYFNSNNKEANQAYTENSSQNNLSYNHRFNLRLDYQIDSNRSIVYTPKVSWQGTTLDQSFSALNSNAADSLNSNKTAYNSKGTGFYINNNLLWRQKLNKPGRTISANLSHEWNKTNTNAQNRTDYAIYNPSDSSYFLYQNTENTAPTQKLATRIEFTEPVGKIGHLQLEYSGNSNYYKSNRETRNIDKISGELESIDTLLSNRYTNRYVTHMGRVMFRIRKEKYWLGTGVGYQYATLDGKQEFPGAVNVYRTFQNLLPALFMNYKFSKDANLRLYYRTNTNAPSITQLQNVIDISNPLLLSTGNPSLKQEYQQNLVVRYSKANTAKSRNFFLGLNGTQTGNYITNGTSFLKADTQISENFTALRGSQLSKPVNLSGYYTARAFSTYGFPVHLIKSTVNLTAGYSFTQTPGMVNGGKNLNKATNTNGGIVLASNFSEALDFTFSWTSNYYTSSNSLQSQLNNQYFLHTAAAKVNYTIKRKLVLYTEYAYNNYNGLGNTFNQKFLLWNASVAYKFLKKNSGEIRITCFDILKQNNSISRTITETYFEDKRTVVLRRYFMATLAYNFRNFGK